MGARARTTSFLIDEDILLDAGTGVEDLTVEELAAIDHVFLTHSHLDHIAALPLLVDSVGGLRQRPVRIHALPETIAALREHIFNWVIWPDFTQIPHHDRPWMEFEPLLPGEVVQVGSRRVRSLPANHTVPAVAFHLSSAEASLVFSGDTSPTDEFWQIVNSVPDLRYLIIETAFPNRDRDLAITAKHVYPILLGDELAKLRRQIEVLVTHLKPSDREVIAQELGAWAGRYAPRVLEQGEILVL
jgi:cAMP phosphodiesterase